MDHRIPLKLHTVLAFGAMDCQIEAVVGQGSNAIVYDAWYPDNLNPALRHRVLIKELFPFHSQQKIQRGADGAIHVAPEAAELWQTHRESFEAGNAIHLRLLADHPELMVMGANLNSFCANGTLYSMLGYSGGRSLLSELNRNASDLRSTACRMLLLLDALEAFHKSGYLHLDISPDNIMLVGQKDRERIFLIDYNSARKVDASGSPYFSFKAGYSAPEVCNGDGAGLGFPSDLYSVAAVFYRSLMGRSLTISDALQFRAPDAQDSPLIASMPQSVASMVSAIVRKGLHTLPRRRYQSIGQMRQAFLELLDRIDCVGVTHWALWETGKRSVEELIRVNPSLRYLKGDSSLYPIRLGQDRSVSLEQYLNKLLSPAGQSGVILAQGGMGKTTLLLHTASLLGKRYSSSTSAVVYLPLDGWTGGNPNYIRTQILLQLRFKKTENTFESAMHALNQLLSQPLHTKSGDIPTVLLLLDGFNEIQEEAGPLIQEIQDLSAMPGVRILAASRSDTPELNLEPVPLKPLDTEDVVSALGQHGLLIPKSSEMLQLLRTPLILSIYIQANESGAQLDIHSKEELMQAYVDSLLEKELHQLPEESPRRWQTEAAIRLVLPALADRAMSAPLTESQTLDVVTRCWKVLRSGVSKKLFPGWIGHSRDILGDAETSEQWYGVVIHGLLWQRLGLLMKDAEGSYRVFHQDVGEYLAAQYRPIRSAALRYRGVRWAALSALVIGVLAGISSLVLPQILNQPVAYDVKQTQTVIDHISLCYSIFGSRLMEMEELTDYLAGGEWIEFQRQYPRYLERAQAPTMMGENVERYLEEISDLEASGDIVAWSEMPFDAASATEFVQTAQEQVEKYLEYLSYMETWCSTERARSFCPEFPDTLQQLLETDELAMSKLYYLSCYPHLQTGEPVWQDGVKYLIAPLPGAGAEPEQSPEKLRNDQQEAEQAMARCCAMVEQIQKEENRTEERE